MTNINNNFIFLRRALKSNSAFSGSAGMVMIATAAPLSQLLGIPQSWIVAGLSAGLILFAAEVYRHARGPSVGNAETKAITIMDTAWVLGSAAFLVLFPNLLNPVGNWLVALVALAVAGFGIAQCFDLKRKCAPAKAGT